MSPNNVSTTNLCHAKSTKRFRTKVNGREPRIRLTPRCAERHFQLTRELGCKAEGQTVEWLLQKVERCVMAITQNGVTLGSTPSSTTLFTPPRSHAVSFQEGNEVVFEGECAKLTGVPSFYETLTKNFRYCSL